MVRPGRQTRAILRVRSSLLVQKRVDSPTAVLYRADANTSFPVTVSPRQLGRPFRLAPFSRQWREDLIVDATTAARGQRKHHHMAPVLRLVSTEAPPLQQYHERVVFSTVAT